MLADRNALGKIIWETSHADEQTISVTGANIVADAILLSDWLIEHDRQVRADERASVLAEQGEPEWEIERVEEARIRYRYGVNSGTLYALNTPGSIAAAVEQHERATMGRIGVEKVETRTRVTRTSPWEPVEENTLTRTNRSEETR